MNLLEAPLAPEYHFFTPALGRTVTTGADDRLIMLPQVALPLENSSAPAESATDQQIGISLYNYLRRFPDCPRNTDYARLLQQAFPYYLSDIASQVIMLEEKDVDALYIRRKISYLKILALLEPENPNLLQKVGIAYFELGMVYAELINVRRELSHAVNYLQKSLRILPRDTMSLNVLGQICYLMGDYSAVLRYWQGVVDMLPECAAKQQLQLRLNRITADQRPARPLINDLEAIGIALEHFAAREFEAATEIMNRLEEEAVVPTEMPSPEFYYFLGLCREKTGEVAAAFESFSKALEVDPQHQASIEAIDRITTHTT